MRSNNIRRWACRGGPANNRGPAVLRRLRRGTCAAMTCGVGIVLVCSGCGGEIGPSPTTPAVERTSTEGGTGTQPSSDAGDTANSQGSSSEVDPDLPMGIEKRTDAPETTLPSVVNTVPAIPAPPTPTLVTE